MRRFLAAAAVASLAGCGHARVSVVSPPEAFPIVRGSVSFGAPVVETSVDALVIRLPVENRGEEALSASRLGATLDDIDGGSHPVTVEAATLAPGESKPLTLRARRRGVASGLAELRLTLDGERAGEIDLEIAGDERGHVKWYLLAAAIVVFIVIATSVTADDCGSGADRPDECGEGSRF